MHILLFIFVFLFTSHSNAAGYSRDNLSYISHIQNEIIHEIAVEKNYVWCATENGIIRYDKRDGEIKRYTTTDGLGSNVISSLAIDNNGVKWFGTADSKGVMSFDGKTWESYYQSYMQGVYVSSIVIDKNNIKYFSFAKGVYRFDGNSWELINVNNPRRVFVDSNDNIWMMFDGNIFLSQNGGDFKEIFPPVPTYIEYCSIAEDNQKTVWIGCDEALLSFDGTNWTVNNRDDGVVDYVNSMAFDKYNIKWIASYSGLWSFDGKVFKNHTDYDAHPVLSDIKIDDDGIIWGAGDGLYSFNPDSSNGVNDFRSPAEFLITGIHPNPFNPSTTISFSLPAAGKAQLAIFDITGQKVRTLISGDLSAGSHSAVWNGRDGDGCAVSSGVYFARLESGKSAQTMKMLLMR